MIAKITLQNNATTLGANYATPRALGTNVKGAGSGSFPQQSSKSFPELSVFDRNEDGKFNSQDAVSDTLMLKDVNTIDVSIKPAVLTKVATEAYQVNPEVDPEEKGETVSLSV